MLWVRIGLNVIPDPNQDPAFYLSADPNPDPNLGSQTQTKSQKKLNFYMKNILK